ncbi:MAG TPA: lipopolysaccharide biosynthesis protein [Bosea sp. (in: a-proteobacteria)]
MRGKSLSRRTLEGFAWMFAGAGGQALLRIVVLAVLARLLTPTDFGVIGAAMTVVALADILSTIGIAPAIVQMPKIGRADLRTAFTISVLSGLTAAALVYAAAPGIASLFRIPAVEPVVRALAVVFVIRGCALVAEAKLQREMRFRALSAIGIASYTVGYGGVAIGLAVADFGIWSLVLGQIVQIAIASACFLICGRHAAVPLLDREVVVRLFGFGAGITLTGLGNYVALNVDQFIVGRALGPAVLGLYNRAYTILMQPVNLLGAVGDKVLFPALASIQSEGDRLARAYCRAVGLIALATIPLSLFLILHARECVLLLLGPQWGELVIPFQILVASLFFRTAYKISSTLLRSRGMIYRLAFWQWLYAGSVCLGALGGVPYGIAGVSVGVGLAILLTFILGLWFSRQACPLPIAEIATTILRYVWLALLVNAPLLAKPFLMAEAGAIVQLAIGAAAVGTMTLAAWFAVPGLFGAEREWLRSAVGRARGSR